MPKWAWISAIFLVLFGSSCKQPEKTGQIVIKVESRITDEPSPVLFGIQPTGRQTPGHWRYLASYTKQEKVARFGIDLNLSRNEQAIGTVRSGVGSFIANPRSDSTVLLADLREFLHASKAPRRDIRVRELPFRFDIVGENLDRGRNGGLIDAATGNWVSVRLFLGPDQESEVWLNFQKPGGSGEFMVKDPGQADAVLRELAKVL